MIRCHRCQEPQSRGHRSVHCGDETCRVSPRPQVREEREGIRHKEPVSVFSR